MSNTNTGGPAFPSPYDDDEGMTLRDYFAAKAMQALIHVQVTTKECQTVQSAYEWADAMLKARES